MRAVYGIVAREFVRFSRQRGRVLASIGRPFVWLVFAGAGFAAVFAGRNQIDYRVYMAPGLLGLIAVILSGLAMGALGLVLAASIRSIENFAGVMNFVIFPMLFLSGALYPVRHLGVVLRAVAYANPLAYGVDLLKHALLGAWVEAGYGGELPVPLDCAALAVFAIVGLALAASLLGREGGVTRTALRERA